MSVSGVVGSEQFADVDGELGSRAILAAFRVAEELHDVLLLFGGVLPQVEAAGQSSDELEAAYCLVSRAAIVEDQNMYLPYAFTSWLLSPNALVKLAR